jgi:ribosomal protein L36
MLQARRLYTRRLYTLRPLPLAGCIRSSLRSVSYLRSLSYPRILLCTSVALALSFASPSSLFYPGFLRPLSLRPALRPCAARCFVWLRWFASNLHFYLRRTRSSIACTLLSARRPYTPAPATACRAVSIRCCTLSHILLRPRLLYVRLLYVRHFALGSSPSPLRPLSSSAPSRARACRVPRRSSLVVVVCQLSY